MQPVGEPIYTFRSKKELIGAFIDVIEGHRALCEEKQILHRVRDISYDNLVLYHDPTFQAHRRGLLIDYDDSSHLDSGVGYSVGFRMGTGPFMSLEILHTVGDEQIEQKPSHGIESIYYVLLYICLKFKGPNNTRRTLEDTRDVSEDKRDIFLPIDQWFRLYPRFRELGEKKRAQLEDIQPRFIEKFTPYFDVLRKCMLDLWDVLFPPLDCVTDGSAVMRNIRACTATHNQVLTILRGVYKNLPDVDDNPGSSSKKELAIGMKKCPADDNIAGPDSGFFLPQ